MFPKLYTQQIDTGEIYWKVNTVCAACFQQYTLYRRLVELTFELHFIHLFIMHYTVRLLCRHILKFKDFPAHLMVVYEMP